MLFGIVPGVLRIEVNEGISMSGRQIGVITRPSTPFFMIDGLSYTIK